MKKLGLFTLALLNLTPIAHAAVGLHGGVTSSNLSTPSGLAASPQTGFMLGLGIEAPINQSVSFAPELSFAQRRSGVTDGAGNKFTAKYNVFELPLFLKASFGEKVRPYLLLGPNFIFNVSDSYQSETAGQIASATFNPRSLNYALDFGAGIEFNPVFISARYSLGLSNFTDGAADWRSRGFQFLLGIRLG